jgi:heme o synthase
MFSHALTDESNVLKFSMFKSLFLTTKPTISLLVIITTLPGILLAAEEFPHPLLVFFTLLGAGMASASAASFNQVVEAEVDSRMLRTKNRSIPSHDLSANVVAVFALVVGVLAFLLLWFVATPLAALIALAGHLFYVFVYTMWLKPRTVQNIVIGGAAGAVGPLIGWAAVTGSLSLEAWLLFLIIFLWTPPHFWSLALYYCDDYKQANIPMYPVVHGEQKTKKLILFYTISLLPLISVLCFWGNSGRFFLVTGNVLTLWFVAKSWMLYRSPNSLQAMKVFHFSCSYALGIFGFLTVDRLYFLFF